MATKVEICNLASTHLGVGHSISNFDTDQSEEGQAYRAVYDIALKVVLREYPLTFTTKITALALIEEDPNTEWQYSYRYPVDCIAIRRILSGSRADTRQSRIPYKIGADSQGIVIWTDQENAEMEYTYYANNPNYYPSDFVLAFSYYLAHIVSKRISVGDQFKLGDRAYQMYLIEISRAAAAGFNESQSEEEIESEFIRTRS